MPKIKLYPDELYPCYFEGGPSHAPEIEVDEKTLRRWRRVMTQFEAVQEEMDAATKAYYKSREEKKD